MTKCFYAAIEFGKTKSFYVAIKYFYVATGLAKVKRNYVTIEYFCVAIEFGLGRGFMSRQGILMSRQSLA